AADSRRSALLLEWGMFCVAAEGTLSGTARTKPAGIVRWHSRARRNRIFESLSSGGSQLLSGRRHFVQGRSNEHGALARSPAAIARPSDCGVRGITAGGDENRSRRPEGAA